MRGLMNVASLLVVMMSVCVVVLSVDVVNYVDVGLVSVVMAVLLRTVWLVVVVVLSLSMSSTCHMLLLVSMMFATCVITGVDVVVDSCIVVVWFCYCVCCCSCVWCCCRCHRHRW